MSPLLSSIALIASLSCGELFFRVFGPEHGMSHNTVHTMGQDSEGYLWFGTYETVDRFDGRAFDNPLADLGLSINRVRDIYSDPAGGLWLATHTGAYHIQGDRVRLHDAVSGLADDSVFCVLRDRAGTLWISTAAGLSRLRAESRETLTTEDGLPHLQVRGLLEDETGTLWAGTRAGLARRLGDRFVAVPLPVAEQPGIYGMSFDRMSRLWLGSDNGLFCLEPDGAATRYDRRHGLPSDEVWAVSVDSFGLLWVGSDAGAVYADLDQAGSVFFQPPHDGDVARTTIYSIDEDREGNLWFGTCIGLYQVHEPAVQGYATDALGAGPMVTAIARDRGERLWLGTDQGVVTYDGGVFENPTAGLDLPDLFVRAILPDEDGGIWLGTRRGAVRRHPDGDVLLDREAGLPDDHILSLHQGRDGAVYLGTLRGGLTIYDDGAIQSFGTRDGLSANRVYAFADHLEAGVWVGTGRGLDLLTPNGVRPFTQPLPGREVSALLVDSGGALWIGTNAGVARLIGEDLVTWSMSGAGPDGARPDWGG